MGNHVLTPHDLPKRLCEGRGPVKQGLTLPYPSGPHWNNLVSNKVARKSYAHGLHEDDVEEEQAYYASLRLRTSTVILGTACAALVCGQVQPSEFDPLIHSMVDVLRRPASWNNLSC